jgi:dTMP kinase
MRGKFITFEGGEGAGKSTQAVALARRLEALGLAVLRTREPGGSPGAEIIRHVLLSGAAKPLGPEAEAMLFAAAREDHVRCTIAPALAAGKWVVCDRFADSTRVYQGALGDVDPRLIKGLERVSIGDLVPDLTLILDAPVEVTMARAAHRRGQTAPDRFEGEGAEFHQKLRDAFRALAADEPQRCVVIDTTAPRQAVAAEIWEVVRARLDPATAPLSVEDQVAAHLAS